MSERKTGDEMKVVEVFQDPAFYEQQLQPKVCFSKGRRNKNIRVRKPPSECAGHPTPCPKPLRQTEKGFWFVLLMEEPGETRRSGDTSQMFRCSQTEGGPLDAGWTLLEEGGRPDLL